MSLNCNRRRLLRPVVWLLLLVAMTALLTYPAESAAAAREGLQLCYQTIIPSLFPFFALSSMAVEFGLAAWLGRRTEGLMRPLFGVSGACSAALMLGLVGGYPVGARCAASLFQKGVITRDEAERLLGFCNNCGPAFIIGVAGAGVFGSSSLGLMLYLIHIMAAIAVGLLLRLLFRRSRTAAAADVPSTPDMPIESIRLSAAFSETIKSAFFSTLGVCGYVVFFAVAVRLLEVSGVLTTLATAVGLVLQPIGIGRTLAKKLLSGLLEVSGGVAALGQDGSPLDLRLCICALLLGWGGLSVHCQAMSFIGPVGLSAKKYMLGKALQGLFSFLLMLLVSHLTSLTRFLPAFASAESSALSARTCVLISAGVMVLWLAAVSAGLRRQRRR